MNFKKFAIIILLIGVLVAGLIWFLNKGRLSKNTPATPDTGEEQFFETEEYRQMREEWIRAMEEVSQTDKDFDGLTDEQEQQYGTNPESVDTDADGLLDITEIETYKTDPLKSDTDGDGFNDGLETRRGKNPLVPDKN